MQTVDFKHFQLDPEDVVLDMGCGEGRHVISAYVEQNVTSIGIDLGFEDLKTTQERFADFDEPENPDKAFGLANANAMSLPFADNTFDKIICSEVLEHIADYKAALKEIERVLKPGGYHEVEGGHLRIFNDDQLRGQIQSLGMKFYKQHFAHALHSPYWWLRCMFHDNADENILVKQYHKFLVWDLMDRPFISRAMEKTLNPVMGKSVVMYFQKTSA